MKKAIIYIMITITSIMSLFSQIPNNFKFHHYMDSEYYVVLQGNIYLYNEGRLQKPLDTSILVNDYGYVYSKYKNEDFLVIGEEDSFGKIFFPKENRDYKIDKDWNVLTRLIKSIKATSFLSEVINGQKVDYKVENLLNSFEDGCREKPYEYNPNSIPWVAGRETQGIGEELTIVFNKPQKGLMLINGYCNIFHQDYFRKNNRIKELTITDNETGEHFLFKLNDIALFQKIMFKKETKNIKLTILSVYPGTKYNDTCIGALFVF